MAHYHAYLASESRLPKEIDIDASDDALAMVEAERMLADAKCRALEVWQGSRLVGRLRSSYPAG